MEMPYHERAAFHYTVGTVFKEIIHPGYKLNKPRDMEPERKRKKQEQDKGSTERIWTESQW